MSELPTQRDFDDFSAWTGRDVLVPRRRAPRRRRADLPRRGHRRARVGAGGARRGRCERPRPARRRERRGGVDPRRAGPRAHRRGAAARGRGHAHRRRVPPALRALRPRVLPGGVPHRPARGRRRAGQADEERPRLRKYVGAPVAGRRAPPRRRTQRRTSARTTEGHRPAPPPRPPPAPIAPPPPRAIPPEGGFQAHAAGARSPAARWRCSSGGRRSRSPSRAGSPP